MDQSPRKSPWSWNQLEGQWQRFSEQVEAHYRKLASEARRQLQAVSDKRHAEPATTLGESTVASKEAPKVEGL